MYDQLLAGNREAMQKLSDQWLPRIYRMAKECVTVEKELADAVQEGNLAVFMSLNHMLGSGRNVDFKFVLEQAAKEAGEAARKAAEAAAREQAVLESRKRLLLWGSLAGGSLLLCLGILGIFLRKKKRR